MYKRVIIFLLLLSIFHFGYGQINDKLEKLSQSVSIQNDTSDWNFSDSYRTCNYFFRILNDTLIIEYDESLEKINHRNTKRLDSTIVLQKMFLQDIDSIDMDIFKSEINISDSLYTSFTGEIYIETQREYPLFKRSYNNNAACKTAFVTIPIYKFSDTIIFRNIIEIIKDEAKKHYKELPPNCALSKITYNKRGDYVEGIKLNSIEKYPTLNDSFNIRQNLNLLIDNYIKENNINLIEGFVIIDTSDQLSTVYIHQEYMSNEFSLEIKKNASELTNNLYGFKITPIQYSNFRAMLKRQKWKTGECNGIKVNTYIEYDSRPEKD